MHGHHSHARSHASMIQELARQAGVTYEEAQAAYQEQLRRLEPEAKVKTFVPVIARRLAREALARRQ